MGDYVYKFWHLVDETLNAILFILIGLEIIPVFAEFQANYLVIMAIVVALVVLSRWIGVTVPIGLLSLKRLLNPRTALIITWGGLWRLEYCFGTQPARQPWRGERPHPFPYLCRGFIHHLGARFNAEKIVK